MENIGHKLARDRRRAKLKYQKIASKIIDKAGVSTDRVFFTENQKDVVTDDNCIVTLRPSTRRRLFDLANACAEVKFRREGSAFPKYDAVRWAHQALRDENINVPRSTTVRAKKELAKHLYEQNAELTDPMKVWLRGYF